MQYQPLTAGLRVSEGVVCSATAGAAGAVVAVGTDGCFGCGAGKDFLRFDFFLAAERRLLRFLARFFAFATDACFGSERTVGATGTGGRDG